MAQVVVSGKVVKGECFAVSAEREELCVVFGVEVDVVANFAVFAGRCCGAVDVVLGELITELVEVDGFGVVVESKHGFDDDEALGGGGGELASCSDMMHNRRERKTHVVLAKVKDLLRLPH